MERNDIVYVFTASFLVEQLLVILYASKMMLLSLSKAKEEKNSLENKTCSLIYF